MMIDDFESEACGWEKCDDCFLIDAITEAKNNETCNECSRSILAGEEIAVFVSSDDLPSEFEYNDNIEIDFYTGEINFNGGKWHGDRHVMCEKCSDLHTSLIEAGHQPILGMVRQCHDDFMQHNNAKGS